MTAEVLAAIGFVMLAIPAAALVIGLLLVWLVAVRDALRGGRGVDRQAAAAIAVLGWVCAGVVLVLIAGAVR